MARTYAIDLSRPAGFALLKPASKPQLDATRIGTLSGSIAVNLLAMGLLMMPMTLPPPARVADTDRDPDIIWVKRETPKPVEVEVVRTPTPPRAAQTIERPRTAAPSQVETSAPVLVENGSEQAIDTSFDEAVGPTDIGPPLTGPAPMQLQYLVAPAPAYPRNALRQNITGTVLLQVIVGIDGRPLEVTVHQSSGNRELDAAAKAQVLKRWSFRPATLNGQAVQAVGLVPIEFKLQ
ncbi:MAG: energy transducer TonB [Thermomonas sp.]|uniref:energy transducer TonB n=1 Tax=Thermomonas sp. TaxID=1971895 RepID=UPI0039E25F09